VLISLIADDVSEVLSSSNFEVTNCCTGGDVVVRVRFHGLFISVDCGDFVHLIPFITGAATGGRGLGTSDGCLDGSGVGNGIVGCAVIGLGVIGTTRVKDTGRDDVGCGDTGATVVATGDWVAGDVVVTTGGVVGDIVGGTAFALVKMALRSSGWHPIYDGGFIDL
jgi:hypothetical protein